MGHCPQLSTPLVLFHLCNIAAPLSPATEGIRLLEGTIIPALGLAKAGVTGIGVPGFEPAVNGVDKLAEMISVSQSTARRPTVNPVLSQIMKGNKKELIELEKGLNQLAAINVPDSSRDLKNRLTVLSL